MMRFRSHTAFIAWVSLTVFATTARLSTAAGPPNIVIIFSDDHGTQAISAYGDQRRLIDTPHIDRLAREGMRFDRCLVANSICGPSRATVLTGKHSHLNGFYNNTNSVFDGAQVTFPKLLQAAGYRTALFGKWHLGSDPTGFDHWHILPRQGRYYSPPMIRNGERVAHAGYVTDVITDLTLEWLRGRDKNKPFLLMTQHKAPHAEWAPALRHLGWDNDRVYPEPDTLFDDYGNGRGLAWRDQEMSLAVTFHERLAKLVRPGGLTAEETRAWDAYYEPRNAAFRRAAPAGRDLVRWRYQRYMHDYLATVKAVDENVGRLLAELELQGLMENTLVIYSSDQGFFLGEHGWYDKRWVLEESVRTPLLVRWPGVTKPGSVSGEIVSVLDFAQTLLEATGVPQPAEMQGRSLVPLLNGRTPADWRTSFYYHFYEFPTPNRVRPHEAVITQRYKLVRYYGNVNDWELYDREVDPTETRNLIAAPNYAATLPELRAELERLRRHYRVPTQTPREAHGRAPFPSEAASATSTPVKLD